LFADFKFSLTQGLYTADLIEEYILAGHPSSKA